MVNWGEGAKGAAGGAATGAAIGSIIPGVGTLAGGIAGGAIGGLTSMFGGGGSKVHTPERADYLLPGFDERDIRLNRMTGQFGQVGGQQARGDQQFLTNYLRDQATGRAGPSAAESVLQGATDRAISSQQALAASGQGNAALLARGAMGNAATLQQQAANEAAGLRAREQQAAQGLMGSVVGQMRGQDIGALSDSRNAQLNAQQLALANAQSQQAGTMGYQNALMNRDIGVAGMPTTGDKWMQGGAGLLTAGIGAGMFS